MLFTALTILVLGYTVVCVLAFALQDKLVFFPVLASHTTTLPTPSLAATACPPWWNATHGRVPPFSCRCHVASAASPSATVWSVL